MKENLGKKWVIVMAAFLTVIIINSVVLYIQNNELKKQEVTHMNAE